MRYTVIPFLAALLLAPAARGQEPSTRARVALALAGADGAAPGRPYGPQTCPCTGAETCTCDPARCGCAACNMEPALRGGYPLPAAWGPGWRWDAVRRTWWRWGGGPPAVLRSAAAPPPAFRPAFAPVMAAGGGGGCSG